MCDKVESYIAFLGTEEVQTTIVDSKVVHTEQFQALLLLSTYLPLVSCDKYILSLELSGKRFTQIYTEIHVLFLKRAKWK